MRHFRTGSIFPMGATPVGKYAVQFVFRNTGKQAIGLVLYEKKSGNREEIPLPEEFCLGNVYSIIVEGIDPKKYTYNLIEEGYETVDPYAKLICGNEKWGEKQANRSGRIGLTKFFWDGDKPLRRPYSDCIFYQLHVRGFTKHPSSGVKHKGTFEGILEKLPHLKELGINTLELLPSYDFSEQETPVVQSLSVNTIQMNEQKVCSAGSFGMAHNPKLNYWGFKSGAYFAPKTSYSANHNPDLSFKRMVKRLHQEEIEIILQFYFEPSTNPVYLLEVLRYWCQEYHVDGFRLLGAEIPIYFLAADPVLCNTKLLYEYFDESRFYEQKFFPFYCNVATYNDSYLYALRHFLKGDTGSLANAFKAMMYQGRKSGNMVYLTNYNSFTLKDLVSYERKHNEENGERGQDGNDNNVSWNCGIEGPSKRKTVLALREQQMKNAIAMLFFSKGIPVLLAGDEFGNSQGGNNNPYCQDNSTSWLNWKDLEKHRSLFDFVKEVIALHKQFPLLKQKDLGTKRTGIDYPYLSYHGKEAWKLIWDEGNKECGGILFCYEQIYLYLCVNMHWQKQVLALPTLPGKPPWILLLDTSGEEAPGSDHHEKSIEMHPRSVKLITAKGKKCDFKEHLSAF